ncbi:MAG: hypothetical protein GW763_00035, partial [Paraglaciecola sp.]|nr:hypothetical protein [Paraglaciecola sp.]
PSQFASSSTGTILGGERDISVDMTQLLGTYAQGSISNGWFGALNMPMLSVGMDWTGEFAFAIQYDGLDGAASRNASPGLNLNAAQAGNALQIGYHRQLINNGNLDGDADPAGNSTWQVSMVDINGQVSSVNQTIVGYQLGGSVNYLNYDFSLFEANNSLFDITNISSIEVTSTIVGMGPGTSWIELTGIAIAGGEYAPLNAPGGGTTGKPLSDVPAPSALALFGIAFGMCAWQRKKLAR